MGGCGSGGETVQRHRAFLTRRALASRCGIAVLGVASSILEPKRCQVPPASVSSKHRWGYSRHSSGSGSAVSRESRVLLETERPKFAEKRRSGRM